MEEVEEEEFRSPHLLLHTAATLQPAEEERVRKRRKRRGRVLTSAAVCRSVRSLEGAESQETVEKPASQGRR